MRRDRSRLPDWPASMRAETAAAYLDVSVGTLALLVQRGKLPAPRALTEGTKVYRRRDLDRLLDLVDPTADAAGPSEADMLDDNDKLCGIDGARGTALP